MRSEKQLARRTAAKVARAAIFICACLALYLCVSVALTLRKVPDLAFLENYQPVARVQLFDRYDSPICNIADAEKREIIPLSQITPHLQRAVLTAEDHHFYEHHGVDPTGILRAILVNLQAGHPVQGGSTITQQLAKNLFFENEKRTLVLKLAEVLVAADLERRFSKEKILELYLNEVYFGNGAYGIEQAARLYFAKHAAALTVAESAYIAGLIRSPSKGGVVSLRKETIARQQEVLSKMREYGYITPEQAQIARSQILVFKRPAADSKIDCQIPVYPYYLSYVLEQVKELFTEGEIQRQGLKIYTNLDPSAQEAAQRVLAQQMKHAPAPMNQGALVSVNVRDSAVVALVGGVGNYMDNQWNCATNPHTVGSAFKPFVYLAAFARGILGPDSEIDDSPLVIKQSQGPDYKPKNYDGKFMGRISVAEALSLSRNVCAVRVAQAVGIDSVIDCARRAGIREPLDPNLSLSLGCSALSPLEMAGAYSTFARGGIAARPRVIRRIENKSGDILCSFSPEEERAFETKPVAQLVDILQEVVTQGTGQQAKLPDRPAAGKTGTADQAKDLWFVGFTPDLVTAVWGGNKDNLPIPGSHVTGGTVMARIWREYNKAYYAKHPTPSGWFVACTRLAPAFMPHKETKKIKPAAAPYTVPNSDSYSGNSYAYYRSSSNPAGGAIVKSQAGVTEYRWSRKGR